MEPKAPQPYQKNLQLELGAIAVGKYEEFQKVRIATMNRIRNIVFRKDTGLDYRELQEKKNKTDEEKEWLKEYTDAKLTKKIQQLQSDNKFSETDSEYISELLTQIDNVVKIEKESENLVRSIVSKDIIYTGFAQYIRGLNVMGCARLLYYFGHCEKAVYPSSLWSYSGLTPNSKHSKGESSGFSARCRVDMYKIGDCLIKLNFVVDKDGETKVADRYRQIYDTEKTRQLNLMESGSDNAPSRLGHADARARRKMIKYLLADYYRFCKTMTGAHQSKPYVIEKLGHVHFDDIIDWLNVKQAQKQRDMFGIGSTTTDTVHVDTNCEA